MGSGQADPASTSLAVALHRWLQHPPKLGELDKIIAARPVLDELAVGHAIHVQVLSREGPTRPRHAQIVPLVRTAERNVAHDEVAFSHDLVEHSMQIGEGGAQPPRGRSEGVGATRGIGAPISWLRKSGATKASATSKFPD